MLAQQNGNGGANGHNRGAEMGDLVLGQHTVDFFLALTLCQQLIVEENPEGPDHPAVYQVCPVLHPSLPSGPIHVCIHLPK